MNTVTISSKFQIVIPKQIRDSLRLVPGQKFQVVAIGNHIELVPIRPLAELRGFVKGIDTNVPRDDDRV